MFANQSSVYRQERKISKISPFFSIGVTTYNRPELLKQTLLSITKQTFSSFEVIVGNDCPEKPLTQKFLGIDDPRIQLINHPQNIGELRNTNALLGMARGKYFTWQFDDDLYTPDFLEMVYLGLTKFHFPSAVFTSYEVVHGTSLPDLKTKRKVLDPLFILSGRQFLRKYFSGELRTMGFTGVYETKYLEKIGGAVRLTNCPFALYSEYILLIQAGLQKKVIYIDAPLILYREHENSWGSTNIDVELYKQAGGNLVSKSIKVFAMPELYGDFYQNLLSILKLTLHVFVCKLVARDGRIDGREIILHLFSLKEQFNSLKGSFLYWVSLVSLVHASLWLTWPVAKLTFKLKVPFRFVKLVRTILFSCHAVRKYFK